MRPSPHAFTERVYAYLPAFYRDADAALDYPLLRWLSLLGDQAGEIEDLYTRIAYIPTDAGGPGGTSELTDPAVADRAWLSWLGQLVGVEVTPAMSDESARDAVSGGSSGWRAATKDAMATAAQSALTGSRHVTVHDHSVASPGDGGEWDVLLVTAPSETPSTAAVLAAVSEKNAKPAGVVLHHHAYEATWAQIDTAYPTWADRNGLTWRELQETGL